jgi:hypothetical protein
MFDRTRMQILIITLLIKTNTLLLKSHLFSELYIHVQSDFSIHVYLNI